MSRADATLDLAFGKPIGNLFGVEVRVSKDIPADEMYFIRKDGIHRREWLDRDVVLINNIDISNE